MVLRSTESEVMGRPRPSTRETPGHSPRPNNRPHTVRVGPLGWQDARARQPAQDQPLMLSIRSPNHDSRLACTMNWMTNHAMTAMAAVTMAIFIQRMIGSK